MEPDVLVVGAGPAGAAVSILLARQGYRVLLVECATCPRDKACAEYLSPAYTPLLAQLGILDAILTAAPQRLHGMRVIDHRGRSCWGRFIKDGQCLYGLALPGLVLDHLLVEQACREGVELRATVRAKLVIAADGVQSTLARRLGLVQRIRWLQHVAFVTHYAGVHPVRPWGEMFLIPSGYIGLAPVSGTLINVSVVVRAAHLAAAQKTSQAFFAQTVQAHPELWPALCAGNPYQKSVNDRTDGSTHGMSAAGWHYIYRGCRRFL